MRMVSLNAGCDRLLTPKLRSSQDTFCFFEVSRLLCGISMLLGIQVTCSILDQPPPFSSPIILSLSLLRRTWHHCHSTCSLVFRITNISYLFVPTHTTGTTFSSPSVCPAFLTYPFIPWRVYCACPWPPLSCRAVYVCP